MREKLIKKISLLPLLLSLALSSWAQILHPVKWSYAAKKINSTEGVVFLKATMEEGWHVYSINQLEGGPIKTSFKFTTSKDFGLTGKVTEPQPISEFSKVFNIKVMSFERAVIFRQKIRLRSPQCIVTGNLSYMACNDHQCLPPEALTFNIPVK